MDAEVVRFCREQRDYVAGLIQQLAGVPAAAAAYTQDAGGAGLGALATLLPLAVPEDSPAELADFIRNPLFLRSPDANARSLVERIGNKEITEAVLYIADEFKTSEGVALGVVMLASTPGEPAMPTHPHFFPSSVDLSTTAPTSAARYAALMRQRAVRLVLYLRHLALTACEAVLKARAEATEQADRLLSTSTQGARLTGEEALVVRHEASEGDAASSSTAGVAVSAPLDAVMAVASRRVELDVRVCGSLVTCASAGAKLPSTHPRRVPVGQHLLNAVARLLKEADAMADYKPEEAEFRTFRHAAAISDALRAARALLWHATTHQLSLLSDGNGRLYQDTIKSARAGLVPDEVAGPALGGELLSLLRVIHAASEALYARPDHSDTNPRFEVLNTLLAALAVALDYRRPKCDTNTPVCAAQLPATADKASAPSYEIASHGRVLALETVRRATAARLAAAEVAAIDQTLAGGGRGRAGHVDFAGPEGQRGSLAEQRARAVAAAEAAGVARGTASDDNPVLEDLAALEDTLLAAAGVRAGGVGVAAPPSPSGDSGGAVSGAASRGVTWRHTGAQGAVCVLLGLWMYAPLRMLPGDVDRHAVDAAGEEEQPLPFRAWPPTFWWPLYGAGWAALTDVGPLVLSPDEALQRLWPREWWGGRPPAALDAIRDRLDRNVTRLLETGFDKRGIHHLCRLVGAPSTQRSPVRQVVVAVLHAAVAELIRCETTAAQGGRGGAAGGPGSGGLGASGALAGSGLAGSGSNQRLRRRPLVFRTRRAHRARWLAAHKRSTLESAEAATPPAVDCLEDVLQLQAQLVRADPNLATNYWCLLGPASRPYPHPIYLRLKAKASEAARAGAAGAADPAASATLLFGCASADSLTFLRYMQPNTLFDANHIADIADDGLGVGVRLRESAWGAAPGGGAGEAAGGRFGTPARAGPAGDAMSNSDELDTPAPVVFDPSAYLRRVGKDLLWEMLESENQIKKLKAEAAARAASLAAGVASGSFGDGAGHGARGGEGRGAAAGSAATARRSHHLNAFGAAPARGGALPGGHGASDFVDDLYTGFGSAAAAAAQAAEVQHLTAQAIAREKELAAGFMSAYCDLLAALGAGPLCADGRSCADHLMHFLHADYAARRLATLAPVHGRFQALLQAHVDLLLPDSAAALAVRYASEDEGAGNGGAGGDAALQEAVLGGAAGRSGLAAGVGEGAAAREGVDSPAGRLTLAMLADTIAAAASAYDPSHLDVRLKDYDRLVKERQRQERLARAAAAQSSTGLFGTGLYAGLGLSEEGLLGRGVAQATVLGPEPEAPDVDQPSPAVLASALGLLTSLCAQADTRFELVRLAVPLPASLVAARQAVENIFMSRDFTTTFVEGVNDFELPAVNAAGLGQATVRSLGGSSRLGGGSGGGLYGGYGSSGGASGGGMMMLGLGAMPGRVGGATSKTHTNILQAVFHLLRLDVPLTVKAAAFKLLAALSRDVSVARDVALMLETHQVFQTLPAAFGVAQAHAGGAVPLSSSGGLTGGLAARDSGVRPELDSVETLQCHYETTLAFCGLLRTLLAADRQGDLRLNLLGATLNPATGELDYNRVPGLLPHVTHVLTSVLGRYNGRTLEPRHLADRWRLSFAGVALILDLVQHYTVVYPPPPLRTLAEAGEDLQRQAAQASAGGVGLGGLSGAAAPAPGARGAAATGPAATPVYTPGDPLFDFVPPAGLPVVPVLDRGEKQELPAPRSPGFEVLRRLLSPADTLLPLLLEVLTQPPFVTGAADTATAPIVAEEAVFHNAEAASGRVGVAALLAGAAGGVAALETDVEAAADAASPAATRARAALLRLAHRFTHEEAAADANRAPSPPANDAASAVHLGHTLPAAAKMALQNARAQLLKGTLAGEAALYEAKYCQRLAAAGADAGAQPVLSTEALAHLEAAAQQQEAPLIQAAAAGCAVQDAVYWRQACVLGVLTVLDAVLARDAAFVDAYRASGVGAGDVGAPPTLMLLTDRLRRLRALPHIAGFTGYAHDPRVGLLAARIIHRLALHSGPELAPAKLLTEALVPPAPAPGVYKRLMDGIGASSGLSTSALISRGYADVMGGQGDGNGAASNPAQEAVASERVRAAHALALRLAFSSCLRDDGSSEAMEEIARVAAGRARVRHVQLAAAAMGFLAPAAVAACLGRQGAGALAGMGPGEGAEGGANGGEGEAAAGARGANGSALAGMPLTSVAVAIGEVPAVELLAPRHRVAVPGAAGVTLPLGIDDGPAAPAGWAAIGGPFSAGAPTDALAAGSLLGAPAGEATLSDVHVAYTPRAAAASQRRGVVLETLVRGAEAGAEFALSRHLSRLLPTGMTLPHFLLGITAPERNSELEVAAPASVVAVSGGPSLLWDIASLLADTTVPGAHVSFLQRQPRVAEACARTIAALVSDPRLALPVLSFLEDAGEALGIAVPAGVPGASAAPLRFLLSRVLASGLATHARLSPPPPVAPPLTTAQWALAVMTGAGSGAEGATGAAGGAGAAELASIALEQARRRRGGAGAVGGSTARADVTGAGPGAGGVASSSFYSSALLPLVARQAISTRHTLAHLLHAAAVDVHLLAAAASADRSGAGLSLAGGRHFSGQRAVQALTDAALRLLPAPAAAGAGGAAAMSGSIAAVRAEALARTQTTLLSGLAALPLEDVPLQAPVVPPALRAALAQYESGEYASYAHAAAVKAASDRVQAVHGAATAVPTGLGLLLSIGGVPYQTYDPEVIRALLAASAPAPASTGVASAVPLTSALAEATGAGASWSTTGHAGFGSSAAAAAVFGAFSAYGGAAAARSGLTAPVAPAGAGSVLAVSASDAAARALLPAGDAGGAAGATAGTGHPQGAAIMAWVREHNAYGLKLQAAEHAVAEWATLASVALRHCVPDPLSATDAAAMAAPPAALSAAATAAAPYADAAAANLRARQAATQGVVMRLLECTLGKLLACPAAPALLVRPLADTALHCVYKLRRDCGGAPPARERVRAAFVALAAVIMRFSPSAAPGASGLQAAASTLVRPDYGWGVDPRSPAGQGNSSLGARDWMAQQPGSSALASQGAAELRSVLYAAMTHFLEYTYGLPLSEGAHAAFPFASRVLSGTRVADVVGVAVESRGAATAAAAAAAAAATKPASPAAAPPPPPPPVPVPFASVQASLADREAAVRGLVAGLADAGLDVLRVAMQDAAGGAASRRPLALVLLAALLNPPVPALDPAAGPAAASGEGLLADVPRGDKALAAILDTVDVASVTAGDPASLGTVGSVLLPGALPADLRQGFWGLRLSWLRQLGAEGSAPNSSLRALVIALADIDAVEHDVLQALQAVRVVSDAAAGSGSGSSSPLASEALGASALLTARLGVPGYSGVAGPAPPPPEGTVKAYVPVGVPITGPRRAADAVVLQVNPFTGRKRLRLALPASGSGAGAGNDDPDEEVPTNILPEPGYAAEYTPEGGRGSSGYSSSLAASVLAGSGASTGGPAPTYAALLQEAVDVSQAFDRTLQLLVWILTAGERGALGALLDAGLLRTLSGLAWARRTLNGVTGVRSLLPDGLVGRGLGSVATSSTEAASLAMLAGASPAAQGLGSVGLEHPVLAAGAVGSSPLAGLTAASLPQAVSVATANASRLQAVLALWTGALALRPADAALAGAVMGWLKRNYALLDTVVQAATAAPTTVAALSVARSAAALLSRLAGMPGVLDGSALDAVDAETPTASGVASPAGGSLDASRLDRLMLQLLAAFLRQPRADPAAQTLAARDGRVDAPAASAAARLLLSVSGRAPSPVASFMSSRPGAPGGTVASWLPGIVPLSAEDFAAYSVPLPHGHPAVLGVTAGTPAGAAGAAGLPLAFTALPWMLGGGGPAAAPGGGRPPAGTFFDVRATEAGEALFASVAGYCRARVMPTPSGRSAVGEALRLVPVTLFRGLEEGGAGESASTAGSGLANGALSIRVLVDAIEQTALSYAHAAWQLQHVVVHSGGALGNVSRSDAAARAGIPVPLPVLERQLAARFAERSLVSALFAFENLLAVWLAQAATQPALRFSPQDLRSLAARPHMAAAFDASRFTQAALRQLKTLGAPQNQPDA